MDAKVVYWTGAWLNFSFLLAFMVVGVRAVRRGEVAVHRRSMLTAAALVALFLLSYVVKLKLLGREDISVWSLLDVTILRIHETCVLVMLIAGTVAVVLARRMRGTRNVTRDRNDPPAAPALARRHRLAGRTAGVAAALGWFTAGFVLCGMYARASDAIPDAKHAQARVLATSSAS